MEKENPFSPRIGDVTEGRRPDISTLLSKIIKGDREAETSFFNVYSPRIRYLVWAKMRGFLKSERDLISREVLNDVHQKVAEKLLISLRNGEIRHPERIRAYICVVIRNVIANHFRRRKKEKACLVQLSLDALQAPQVTPETDTIKNELIGILRKEITRLDSKYRDVLYLSLVREFTVKEIAQIMKMNPQRISEIKMYGIKKVTETIRAHYDG
jgi:RNA polymerase sigma factor (sigma-70 family)